MLDNCFSQTDLNQAYLLDILTVVYLPTNITSGHQPEDMGMIASIKVGYKTTLLRNLLSMFDIEGGYHDTARQIAHTPRGCKGLIYGRKETVLDTMIILDDIW